MAHAVRAEPECSQGLHVREVEFGAAVDADRAERSDARQVHVDSELFADPVARDCQADEIRARRAAREGRAAMRQLEEIGDPAEGRLLELRRRRCESPEARVLVDAHCPRLRDRAGREQTTGHVAEVPTAGRRCETWRHPVDELRENVCERHAVLGQGLGQPLAERPRIDVDARVRRRNEGRAEMLREPGERPLEIGRVGLDRAESGVAGVS